MELRDLCNVNGESVAKWSRDRGFSPALVYRVLRGETSANRGQTHKIAQELGLKRKATDAEVALFQRGATQNSENRSEKEINM